VKTGARLARRSRSDSVGRARSDDAARVFLSYRREDVPDATDRLADSLTTRLGRDRVFLDVDNIEIGAPFAQVVASWIGRCTVLLAVIGRSWLTATDDDGACRLDDPNDYVRLEIEEALSQGIPVVPVLIHGAQIPKPGQLPASLVRLLERNAIELSRAHWELDIDHLLGAIERITRERLDVDGAADQTARTSARALPGARRSVATLPAQASTQRNVLVVIAAAGALTAASVLALGGAGAGPRIVHDDLVSMSYPSSWRPLARAPAEDAALLLTPLSVQDGTTTLSAGRLTASAATPGDVPPGLAARLHAPASGSTVRLGPYQARRYVWYGAAGAQTVVLVLAAHRGDVALLCRSASATAGCNPVAATAKVAEEVDSPEPDAQTAATLAGALQSVSAARRSSASLSGHGLSARATPARRIAVTETRAATTLGRASLAPRNEPTVRALATALLAEARGWAALATAARQGQRGAYGAARAAVSRDGRALALAVGRLRAQGFTLPALAPVTPPQPPAPQSHAPAVQAQPPTSAPQASEPVRVAPEPPPTSLSTTHAPSGEHFQSSEGVAK
jgi:hypothetical protein